MAESGDIMRYFSAYLVEVQPHFSGGTQLLFKFENGYGLSIVPESRPRARPSGGVSWELLPNEAEVAIIYWTNDDYFLSYDHEELFGVNECVRRHQSAEEVFELLEAVQRLPPSEI